MSGIFESPNHKSIEERYPLVKGEVALWNGVILQALLDATSNSKKPEAKVAKREALTFLTTHNQMFYNICDMAQRDPEYTFMQVQRALLNNCQWRLPAGKGWRTALKRQLSGEDPLP